MNPTADLLAGLNEALSFTGNSAIFSYLSGSIPVSCSGVPSYDFGIRYGNTEFDYLKQYTDASIIVKTSDAGSWGLEPKKSVVYIDGVKYLVGGMINRNDAFMQITLRANLSNG